MVETATAVHKLEDYEGLIAKLAHTYLNRMPHSFFFKTTTEKVDSRKVRPTEGLVTVDDLMNEGIIVFYESRPNYDPSRGAFSTFLTYAIKSCFMNLLKTEWQSYNRFECLGRRSNHLPAPTSEEIVDQELLKSLKLKVADKRFLDALLNPTAEMKEKLNKVIEERPRQPRSEGYAYLLGSLLGMSRAKVQKAVQRIQDRVEEIEMGPLAGRISQVCWQ